MFRLREPQQLAYNAIVSTWDKDPRPTLCEIATGVGKTPLAAAIAKNRASMGRTMFVAHRKELIWQAAKTFDTVVGEGPAIEMAKHRAHDDLFGQRANAVIASVQTLLAGYEGRGRISRYNPFDFATLIMDECHHYPKNKGKWHTIISHFSQNPRCRVLGLTATADRADQKALGTIFGTVSFVYPIKQAIDEGWLVPIDLAAATLKDVDLTNVREIAGELDAKQVQQILEVDKNLFAIANELLSRCGNRKTLVFCSGVRHAALLTAILNKRRPACAEYVCDKTDEDDRTTIFANFKNYHNGQGPQFLCNFGIATEGFDDCGIEVVAIARFTLSRSLFAQMIGRGTRVLPGVVDDYELADDRLVAIAQSDKPRCEVLEFVGNSGRHKLVSAADLLGGDYSEAVCKRAQRLVTDAEARPIVDTLKIAQFQIWEEEKQRAQQEEYDRLAMAQVSATVTYEKVDPFNVASSEAERREKWNKPSHIPDKMAQIILRHGPKHVDAERLKKMGIGDAAAIYRDITSRWKDKVSSIRQDSLLSYLRLPTRVPIEVASHWIDRWKQCGKRVPKDVRDEANALNRSNML